MTPQEAKLLEQMEMDRKVLKKRAYQGASKDIGLTPGQKTVIRKQALRRWNDGGPIISKEEVKKLFDSGVQVFRIAERLKCSTNYIYRVLKKANEGLTTRQARRKRLGLEK